MPNSLHTARVEHSRHAGAVERRRRRRFAFALAASVLLHVCLMALRFDLSADAPADLETARNGMRRPASIRVIDIVTIPTTQAQVASIAPVRRTRPTPPPAIDDARVQASALVAEAPGRSDPGRALVDRIIPHSGDPRLLDRRPAPLAPAMDRLDGTRVRVEAGARAIADSVNAAIADSTARANAWTHVDGQGRVWGATPGVILLGERRLSLCGGSYNPADCGFVPPPGQRELMKERLTGFNEIRLQRSRADVDRQIEERMRAIRRRTAALRDTSR